MYGYFGWDYTPELESRMRSYLDLETERARYRRYQDRFRVPSEVT